MKGFQPPNEEYLQTLMGSSWMFVDSLSGDFFTSTVTFRPDSLHFSAHRGRGFTWTLNGTTVEGERYLEGYRHESVRMLLSNLAKLPVVDDNGDTTYEITMTAKGFFAESDLTQLDTLWSFGGTLLRL